MIPGIEVTTEGYDILGLGVDPYNSDFQDFLRKVRESEDKITQRRLEALRENGISIDTEKIRTHFPGRISRYNIFLAMHQTPNIRNLMRGAHPHFSLRELYNFYVGRGSSISGIKNEDKTDPKEAIGQIHLAGGKAILAHPFKQIDFATQRDKLDRLLDYGFDGIDNQPHFGEKNLLFVDYANRHGLIVTHGSDYHHSEDPRRLLGRGENLMLISDLNKIIGKVN